jgi:hypothetical protein
MPGISRLHITVAIQCICQHPADERGIPGLPLASSPADVVRGWFVEAGSGDFRIKPTTDGHVEVHTARGHSRLVYSYEGPLISRTPEYADAFERIEPGSELQMTIPFNWLLWPLISPAWAWLTGVLGSIGVGLVGKCPRGWC